MILIADSGSTKADWIAGENNKILFQFNSKGMNPFFHDKQFVLHELETNETAAKIKNDVKQIYFFGAGCSSDERNSIIHSGLVSFFTNAKVVVDHDMLGSAISVCEGKPGMACILGTGSNIGYFDGKDIAKSNHGLGYVIGDEGSGSYFGKKLLSQYLYKLLPVELETEFRKKYNLDKESIIKKVYHDANPNVFLASFAKFLSDHAQHAYIQNMVLLGMREFFATNVLAYEESKTVPVHFVGSIAWFFKEILHKVADENNIIVGNIIQKPISGLAEYFLSGGKMP